MDFTIEKKGSTIDFTMQAPVEKIFGAASNSASGSLHIDLTDLSKSTGLLNVDISGLVISQQKRGDEKSDFGEKNTIDTQNQHARAWLEIDDKAPADVRKQNSTVSFSIKTVEKAEPKDVTKLSGAKRTAKLRISGEFLLHGRKSNKTADVEATFSFDGDRCTGVKVTSLKPFTVNLDEHDVRPREFFGKLAQKTLSQLSSKVNKEAEVSVSFSALVAPKTAPVAPKTAPVAPKTAPVAPKTAPVAPGTKKTKSNY
jgi:hypothetical protein